MSLRYSGPRVDLEYIYIYKRCHWGPNRLAHLVDFDCHSIIEDLRQDFFLKRFQQLGLVLWTSRPQGRPLESQSLAQERSHTGSLREFGARHEGEGVKCTIEPKDIDVLQEVVGPNKVNDEVNTICNLPDFFLKVYLALIEGTTQIIVTYFVSCS